MWQAISYYASLFLEAAAGVFGLRLYEEPRYQVVERLSDRVEIRRYAPRLAVEVSVPQTGEAGRSEAFQLLFDYIAGANHSVDAAAARIAMTMPVPAMESAGGVRMQFFLPATYTLDTAPRPRNAGIQLRLLPEQTLAALRYSGSHRNSSHRYGELIAHLSRASWQPTGAAFSQFYDAPFTLPPLRRNEAVVPVTEAG